MDNAVMSYDLAVWDGPKPADDELALAEYERRMDAMEQALDDGDTDLEPTPAIQAFVDAALSLFPELDEESGPECPWASSPLEAEAVGDFIYFPLTFSGAEYARDPLAEVADSLGLVCFDPQIEQLLPDAHATPASTISAAAHEALERRLEEDRGGVRPNWLRRVFGRG